MKWELVRAFFLKFIGDVFMFVGPFGVNLIIQYAEDPESAWFLQTYFGYLCVIAMFVAQICATLLIQHHAHIMFRFFFFFFHFCFLKLKKKKWICFCGPKTKRISSPWAKAKQKRKQGANTPHNTHTQRTHTRTQKANSVCIIIIIIISVLQKRSTYAVVVDIPHLPKNTNTGFICEARPY